MLKIRPEILRDEKGTSTGEIWISGSDTVCSEMKMDILGRGCESELPNFSFPELSNITVYDN